MPWKPPRFFVFGSALGLTLGAAVLVKDAILGHNSMLDKKIRADGKVVIITGANTGIGKETARELARRGAKVYMACRDLDRCNKARIEIIKDTENKAVYCRKCDLADFNSITQFVTQFKYESNRLDILINNGGVMRTPKSVTRQGIEMQLGVNHMGHFLLTHQLLPLLKASAPSRIVVVSSVAHTSADIKFDDLNSDKEYDPGEAYNQSKLANILFTRHLAKQLKGTGVTVNALHPGVVNTEIARHMGFEKSYLAKIFVKPLMSFFLKSPQQGAMTTIFVALEPALENVSGKYFSDSKEKEPSLAAQNDADAERLWAISQRWTLGRNESDNPTSVAGAATDQDVKMTFFMPKL